MSVINKDEKAKLAVMYEGDKPRDASDKVRGFLFQDYVAINCLLQEHVECVCSEYLEDVDVFFDDKRFEFIQVKYYPGTSPVMKDILTDLYYQFLRLRMLDSHLIPVPRLYIHRDQDFDVLTVEDMKWYMGYENNSPKGSNQNSPAPNGRLKATADYPDVPDEWLKTNVHPLKKDPQKQKLFDEMAAEDSLSEFVNAFKIKKQHDIERYREELKETLSRTYQNNNPSINDDQWQQILLGLAITHIQKRYTRKKIKSAQPDDAFFDDLKVSRAAFDDYIKKAFSATPDHRIAGYLTGLATAEFEKISDSELLDDLQRDMLNRIYLKTVAWISELIADEGGQYKLLNTISAEAPHRIANYPDLGSNEKYEKFTECKRDFCLFLRYLWKIILNICQDKLDDQAVLDQYDRLFDPKTYIDLNVRDYVCLNFPQDPYVNRSVILPAPLDEFKVITRRITARMVNVPRRPEKWFFKNSKIKAGKNYYSYNTANISENPTVADLGEDTFYIECMDCIHTDGDEWSEHENCGDCIFSLKCVKERL